MNLKGKLQSKTGVDFCCYKKDEYKKLTKYQRAKWYECQNSNDGKDFINKQRQYYGKPPKVSDKKKL